MLVQNERKGFTLVELLAVIVILAIIMIIAIPSVLSTVETAKQKTFRQFMQKAYNAGVQKLFLMEEFDGIQRPSGYDQVAYIFDVDDDLDLSNTGDFEGLFIAFYYGERYAEILNEDKPDGSSIKPYEWYYFLTIKNGSYASVFDTSDQAFIDDAALASISELEAHRSEGLDELEIMTDKNKYFDICNKNYDSFTPGTKAVYPITIYFDGKTNERRFDTKNR
jgi:prepilin-type N-terminal cleavage/methylation domain-containing protein